MTQSTVPSLTQKIEMVDIELLKPYPNNPRVWSAVEEKQLTESIQKFGMVSPLLVNSSPGRKGLVIGGNFRLSIYKKVGIKLVSVQYINITDEKTEQELNLRLNRNQGSWSWDLLKEYAIDDLIKVGFDEIDLSKYWDNELGVEDDNFDIKKAVEEVKKNPVSKPGDLFQLGNHKVICGDCTDLEVVKRLVGEEKVSYINCDPPYNIKLDYSKGVGNESQYGGVEKDNRTIEEYTKLLSSSLTNALAISKSDTHIFYWCDEKYVWLVQGLFKNAGLRNERLCIWIKNNQSVTPKSAFNKMTEYCCYAIKGKPYLNDAIRNLNEIQNKEIATGNRSADDIMDLLNLWLVDRLPANEYQHPTMKPPQLYEKAMRRCTKVGDTILDSFGGSGSQLLAAEQLKRRALLIEIDPVFVDLILYRYEQFTGIKPIKINK
jgi:DNA modification methylase